MKKLWLLVPLAFLFAVGCAKKATTPPPGPPAPPVSVAVSPGSATVTVTTTQPFVATVTGATDQSVTWSLSGAGTINATTGQYTAPASVPTPATATVTATSNADRSKSASATVTIANPVNNALWNGRYAFLFDGFEPDDPGAAAVAGTFVANGNTTSGGITEGLVDINRPGSVILAEAIVPAGSSYIIGADRRGTIRLNTNQGLFTLRFVLVSANGDTARFAEFETSQIGGIRGSGIIRKQVPGPFSERMLNGDFAFGFSGTNLPGSRIGAVGRFNLDGASQLTQGNVDIGTADGSIEGSFPMRGTYGSIDPNNGRGRAALTVTGVPTPFNFAFYIVSVSEALFAGMDTRTTNPLLSGSVLKQTGFPFSNASMNGPIVFSYRGNAGGGTGARVTIGRVVAGGAAGNLTEGALDRNNGGVLTATAFATGTYAISDAPVRGRGTMTFNTTPPLTFVFYMVNSDVPTPNQRRAFLMETSGAEVGTGLLEAQTSMAAPSGTYFVGNVNPPTCGCAILVGWIAVSGTGFSGTQDRSEFPAGIIPDRAWVGTITSSSPNGRGSATTNSPVTENFVFYVISPTKFVAINGFDPGNTQSAITFFER